jgi:hypothetical protein
MDTTRPPVQYTVKINKINGAEFIRNGSTNTGLDLQLINATMLPRNSHVNITINVTRFNDEVVNEYTKTQMMIIP